MRPVHVPAAVLDRVAGQEGAALERFAGLPDADRRRVVGTYLEGAWGPSRAWPVPVAARAAARRCQARPYSLAQGVAAALWWFCLGAETF